MKIINTEGGWQIPGIAGGERGEVVDVPDKIGKELLERPGFKKAASKPAKEGN